MFKSIMKSALVGAAVMALAAPASAATVEINIYGASAQYLYWNDAADDFLKAAPRSCGAGIIVQKESADKKHGATYTTGNCPDGNTYIIRYSSKASYDGICAVKGLPAAAGSCETGCAVAGQSNNQRNRPMCDQTLATPCDTAALKCVTVTLGASDVAGESFLQSSSGQKLGPAGGGAISRSFSGINASGLSFQQPLVVPFGFFANNSVKMYRCLEPTPVQPTNTDKAISAWGNQCYDPDQDGKSADCIGYYKCVNKVCTGGVNAGAACDEVKDCPDVALSATNCDQVPIDNLSRLMATMIFNGQAIAWSDFGAWYGTDPIVACLRHAGSGTQATMDLAVMTAGKSGWGAPLLTSEVPGSVYFNDGSTDLMRCVCGYDDSCDTSGTPPKNKCKIATSVSCTSDAQCPDWSGTGAIGFADADQLYGTKASSGAKFPFEQCHALKYQGVEPKRSKIRNGEYDFWSVQWIYYNSNDANLATINALMTHAKNPANVPVTKADYWATFNEMVYMKGNDFQYPGYLGATTPQTP